MSCRDMQELLSAYVDGELSGAQKQSVEEHLSGCADCRSTVAAYRKIRDQLVSLGATSRAGNVKEAVMSRIKADALATRRRRWLRPVLVGAPIAVVLAIAATLFSMTYSRQTKDVLAQAIASTQGLKSYRVHDVAQVSEAGTGKWLTDYYKDVDYAGPGRLLTKARYTASYSDNTTGWQNVEFIIIGDSTYLYGSTPPLSATGGSTSEGWGQLTASIQQPADSLKLLGTMKMMPDEEIDGAECLHYEGMANMDLYIKQYLADAEARARDTGSSWTQQHANALEALLRGKQIELNFWIGKNDGLLHQWQVVYTQSPKAKTSLGSDLTETIRYYDFNKEIVVSPPVDSEGHLLPGWRLQNAQ